MNMSGFAEILWGITALAIGAAHAAVIYKSAKMKDRMFLEEKYYVEYRSKQSVKKQSYLTKSR